MTEPILSVAEPAATADVDRTARTIKGDDPVRAPTLERRQGKIVAVDVPNAKVDLTLGGNSVVIPGVSHVSNYRPNVNDTVWVDVNGPDLLALDRIGAYGPSVVSEAVSATVSTTETRSSTSYGDLSTAGPSVTVSVSPSGRLLVQVSAFIECGDLDGGMMGAQLTGANSVSPSIFNSVIVYIGRLNAGGGASKVILYTGLTPGDTTITAKYRAVSGDSNGAFSSRQVWAFPL